MRYKRCGPTRIRARIARVKVNEGGLYQCVVSLSDGSTSIVRFNVKVIKVHQFFRKDISVHERSDAKLSVSLPSGFKLRSITWFCNVKISRSYRIVADGVRFITSTNPIFLLLRFVI